MASKPVVERDTTGWLVDLSCSDKAKFHRATNEQVWEKLDGLVALQLQPGMTTIV